jgi:NAD(P)-dependent dehydrogenase (short-subunit alcohol dehydrogenase family)
MPKVAVITGGAGGMGLATARLISRDYTVLISDVSQARLQRAHRALAHDEVECTTITCDLTDDRSVRQLAAKAQRLGQVACVIHTAGVSPSMGSPEHILRINAVGAVLVNRAFYGIATAGMALVNMASVAGHQLPRAMTSTRRYKRSTTGWKPATS